VIRWLVSALLYLAANALGLWIADLALDDMSLSGSAFVTAVLIFTLVEVLIQPLLTQMAIKGAGVLRGSVALVATFIGLLVTSLISDGMSIDGFVTWVAATVIVWLAALLAGLILPLIFVKKVVENNND
jgi:putative membrane protein